MPARRTSRAFAALGAALALGAVAAPAAPASSTHTFKVDLLFEQETDWNHRVQYPRDHDCISWIYAGEGDGYLKGQLRAGRVTFRDVRGRALIQSNELRMPAYVLGAAAQYTVSQVGPTRDNCPQATQPPPPDTSACNDLVTLRGSIRVILAVAGGRMLAIGGFYPPNPATKRCPDPSMYTASVSYAGHLPRSDLDTLIHNRRVRTIQLATPRRRRAFGPANLTAFATNFGSYTRILSGGGSGMSRWSIKLTRIT